MNSLYLNSFDSVKDFLYNQGKYLFECNHLRRHGGLEYIIPYEKLEKVTEWIVLVQLDFQGIQ